MSRRRIRARHARTWPLLRVIPLILVACGLHTRSPEVPAWSQRAARAIRARIRGPATAPRLQVGGELRPTSAQLIRFYERRRQRPAWCAPRGPTAHADALLAALAEVAADGLDPRSYGLTELRCRISRWRGGAGGAASDPLGRLAELDLLLTQAFLCCAADLQRGRVAPQRLHASWQARPPRTDLSGLLQTALDLGRVKPALLGLRPPQPGYAQLRRMLHRYRALASHGEWPRVEPGRGETRALQQRLAATGDLGAGEGVSELSTALCRFQRRHGLLASGTLDSLTRAALDVSLAQRTDQIRVNMERWRWLPHDPGARYVLVRLADFELDAVAGGEVVLRSRVIVGRRFWRTPIFSAAMTQVELNPAWYVPRSISVQEMLPRIQQDSTYLQRHQLEVIVGRGDTAYTVDGNSIDWGQQTADHFAYVLRQRAGAENPLGRVKFYFANPHDVFLHDTPNTALFDLPRRDLSHGCIRVQRSLELAAFVLGTDWPLPRLQAAVAQGAYQALAVTPAVPVYLLYWTAWVDAEGQLQFRDDWYAADTKLSAALGGASCP